MAFTLLGVRQATLELSHSAYRSTDCISTQGVYMDDRHLRASCIRILLDITSTVLVHTAIDLYPFVFDLVNFVAAAFCIGSWALQRAVSPQPHPGAFWGSVVHRQKCRSLHIVLAYSLWRYTPFTRGSMHEAHTKHTFAIYTVVKPARRVHDMCCKFASIMYASCMLPRVNGVLVGCFSLVVFFSSCWPGVT